MSNKLNTSAEQPLMYESNPKHKDPWQSGRKGSLCERDMHEHAQRLLEGSVLAKSKRYAVHNGKAYCAQEHTANCWHGYPIGWIEVPAKVVRQWENDGLVKKRDLKNFWETH